MFVINEHERTSTQFYTIMLLRITQQTKASNWFRVSCI